MPRSLGGTAVLQRRRAKRGQPHWASSLYGPAFMKTPLSLLFERCHQNGWNLPVVETPRNKHGSEGFTFVVIFSRRNIETGLTESVHIKPHAPYALSSARDARRYGATYALHRIASHLQLDRILPHGPREYWMQLNTERRVAPAQLAWMYAPDPWAAELERRPAKDS
ncbi:hypothetical protein EXIGLDRAFT_835510 [Exidia glandulosa HHB12029]|uniref:ATP-dependent RNA helicase DHX29 DSRM-like domain-containing protein n=1 Tax=Exidia glandulosa HHB12029 TaxID=1314781 RepID=A0A165IPB0_EXIGL|nr:hypothetical protein EXIGLDRAFT_835510 [Exidia glandulosa HHB12029]